MKSIPAVSQLRGFRTAAQTWAPNEKRADCHPPFTAEANLPKELLVSYSESPGEEQAGREQSAEQQA